MALSRREMLAGAFGAAALWSVPGWAQEVPLQTQPTVPVPPVTQVPPVPPVAQPPTVPAPGFVVDWQSGPQSPDTAASLAAQIALVKGLAIKPEAMAFFAAQPIVVDLATGTGTRASNTGVIFGRRPVPADNPVLLHELLHRYHFEKLAHGYDNPEIIAFYNAAKAAGAYPANEYMFKDCGEFFAMCGSVTLYGKAARQPLKRASVEKNLPEIYAWVVNEFGLVI
ncbi:MAG: hypothetical protein JWL96_1657 [Sphingomonas bacterium]|uniref:hypothetical protein n=1 Tax=Sphingomonas bacterium TaxID=1895847 RepID=UPI00261EC3E8|nr:hypothetical protein [Sphingomonas bacterium]MDB5709587.1 hypothetical protein [Sphingomonas bacterium]